MGTYCIMFGLSLAGVQSWIGLGIWLEIIHSSAWRFENTKQADWDGSIDKTLLLTVQPSSAWPFSMCLKCSTGQMLSRRTQRRWGHALSLCHCYQHLISLNDSLPQVEIHYSEWRSGQKEWSCVAHGTENRAVHLRKYQTLFRLTKGDSS